MPTYEYKCTECNHLFEMFQSIKDPPIKKCPKCKGNVKKLISGGSGILFKGSGFYATDYRSKSYKETKEKRESVNKPKCKDCPAKKPKEGKT